ncbi:hypothetical protein GGX14DRAFT_692045 [Mycena pura]|uniref:DUF6534 domain-containing protein n=1 Tax=Mycena pura TaxID=153505 RepID=A0AAD6YUL7_9AGAR|nr:hypothetical protein GGX14DRAFT_692045 [Mycena pura]
MADVAVDVPSTLGALLIGGSIALMLSGTLAVQCIVFYKLYPNDTRIRTVMVLVIWCAFPSSVVPSHFERRFRRILDLLNSAFIVSSLFIYLINYFGDRSRIDDIPWSIAFTVVVTAIQTLIVHWYFAHKIYMCAPCILHLRPATFLTHTIRCFSERQELVDNGAHRAYPSVFRHVFLAFLRVLAASVSTSEMIMLKRYSAFTRTYPGWVFTTGLALSATVDIIITGWLCYFLQKMRRRTSSTPMARVMHTLTLYTLENGMITCITTTASLICWLTMRTNLVFLGLHFVIGKLYANSLLVSLNTRKELREMRWTEDGASASGWPVLSSGGGELTVPYGTTVMNSGGAYTYPYSVVTSYGGHPGASIATSDYRPAFKVPAPPRARPPPAEVGVRVTRVVRHSSDDLSVSDVSRDEYTYTAHISAGGRHHPPRRRSRSPRRHGPEHLRSLP